MAYIPKMADDANARTRRRKNDCRGRNKKDDFGTEWLLLRRCNLSNIGGLVYVSVRVSARVIFIISWARPDMVTYV